MTVESSNRPPARAYGEHSSAEQVVGVVRAGEGSQCERPPSKAKLGLQKLPREDILQLADTLALPERTPTAGRGRGQGYSHVREGRLRRQRGRRATPREKLTLAQLGQNAPQTQSPTEHSDSSSRPPAGGGW